MFVSFTLSLVWTVKLAYGDGLLLLYRPRDISSDCAASRHLRFDLSFGMGMSDTTTLVFRTLNDFDYGCEVEVTTESSDLHLLVVIRYPNSVANNCAVNRNAFIVLKKSKCLRLCDLVGHRDVLSPYYILTLRERIRFQFISNSSVNSDMNANLYQVTVTAARTAPAAGCSRRNETVCTIDGNDYCFTSGVVCDGINNCGVADWFDERKAQCGVPVESLGLAPVVAVLSAVLCALLVAGRALHRCLPPATDSFFIFNANEDNRLCIDTVHRASDFPSLLDDTVRKTSIIPVFSDSSTESEVAASKVEEVIVQQSTVRLGVTERDISKSVKVQELKPSSRKITMSSFTASLQRRLRSVANHTKRSSAASVPALDI